MANEQQWVAFRLGPEVYGLPIESVREIVRVPEVTPVPQAPEHVAGVMNLRGHIIPVVDLGKRLHGTRACGAPKGECESLAAQELRRKARVLVLAVEGKWTGLLVDEASEVLKIAPAEIEASSTLFAGEADSYVSGIAKQQGRLVVLLDAEKLLHREPPGIGETEISAPSAGPRVLAAEAAKL